MVMSRDHGFKFQKFLFLPYSVSNFKKSYQIWGNWLKNKNVTGKKQFGGGNTPSAYRVNASVNSKHQHPPGLIPGEFFKVVKFPAPGQKIFAKLRPRGKKVDKNPAPGDNFAMIVKPFPFFWYSSLACLSSGFFKDYKACEYKISQ